MTNILIVEDESIVAWDIKETLEKLGHQVVDLVGSGAEAIRSATTSHPDLVLMDIRLAGEMDGIRAGAEIYERLNIPVVYITANADERTLERATQTNPFGYIIKPFQWQTLQSTIKVALQRHRSELATNLNRSGLTNTLNSIGKGIIVTDRQGVVTFINSMAQELTGWTATEALGKQIGDVFRLHWESDGMAIENPGMRAMRLQQPVNSPHRCWLVTKYGAEIPISDTATPLYQSDGEVVGSTIVFDNNIERLSAEMDLLEHNQDLEDFQLNLICQLQIKTAEYRQATACLEVLNNIFDRVRTATTETELLHDALQHLGMALAADYCWCTIHDSQDSTARIISEYVNTEHHIYPASKVGQKINMLRYPQFYNYLCEGKSWIDPPAEITPEQYLGLVDPAAQTIVCPILAAAPGAEYALDRIEDWAIGEIGIVNTGKPLWTSDQARLISQIFSYAVKFFR
ncbi:response regulator [Chamaesiphon minutus]|uniref:response regulator n=1 Tax=Chamaesiphon minutus TaxID=1173032 RepID=UPI0002E852B1|nr:response regulator [Chamaesiphon minutus]